MPSRTCAMVLAALLAGCAAGPTATAPRPAPPSPAAATETASGPRLRVVPINAGEAIVEPFWNPQLSGFTAWRTGGLAQVRQEWCWVEASWPAGSTAAPVLSLERACDLDLSGYRQLVVALAVPVGTTVAIEVDTELGPRRREGTAAVAITDEHAVDLGGATRVRRIAITLRATAAGSAHLLWVGAADPALAAAERARWTRLAAQGVDPYLVPADRAPGFAPTIGIIADRDGLDRARSALAAYRARCATDPTDPSRFAAFDPAAWLGADRSGDSIIGDRFDRAAEHGRPPLAIAEAAFAATVHRDAALLRQAVAAAVMLAQTPHWDTHLSRVPGSAWDHISFSHAMAAWHLAVAVDLGGDLLSPAGKDLILRRLAEEGLGNMNYATWRYDYIFGCNQLLAFSRGRIPAYLALERSWRHVAPYTDLALAEMRESFARNLLPDGGFVEGPAYFAYTLGQSLPALAAAARVRGVAPAAIIPPELAATVRYVSALASTDRAGGLIPIGDAAHWTGGRFLTPAVHAQMAAFFPGTAWEALWAQRAAELAGKLPASPEVWTCPPPGSAALPALDALVELPDLGIVASHRRLGGDPVKLLLIGGPAGAGHNHEDKGSFVLEYAGDTFACEPGGWSYADARSGLQKVAQRHTMLVPTGCAVRPAPRNPLAVAVKPIARGDATAFTAEIEAGLAWPDHYRTWTRRIVSPDPGRIEIRDSWALRQGDGVDAVWVTRLPVRIDGRTVEMRGRRGLARIVAPEGVTVASEELVLEQGAMTGLRFHQAGTAGELALEVELSPLPGRTE